ncbi:unnamed protein product, partial [Strongylus vulgaris]
VNILSPSLFSLHGEADSDIEKNTSLKHLLDGTGLLNDRDRQEWMDFIIETAGIADAMDMVKVH